MRQRYLRRGTQGLGIFLGLLGITGIGMTHVIFPGLHCYACPLSATVCPIGVLQNLVIAGTAPFYLLGVLAVYGVFLGRGWCGWFCPFGTVNDLLSWRKVRFHKAFSPLKFLVLLGTVFAAWRLADTWFCKLCPAASLTASLPYFAMGLAQPTRPFFIHMGTLAATLIGMTLVARFWCRYLCPMGAILALFNRVSLFGLGFNQKKCTSCGLCLRACPMGIDPRSEVNSTNCIKCGECSSACPQGALSLGFSLPGARGYAPLRFPWPRSRANRVPPGK